MDSRDSTTNAGEPSLLEYAMIDGLTAILGFTQLLMEMHARDPHSLKHLSSIKKATEGLIELIDRKEK
jgi:hypothetical protein